MIWEIEEHLRKHLIKNSKNAELLKQCLDLKDQDKQEELMELIGSYHKDDKWSCKGFQN